MADSPTQSESRPPPAAPSLSRPPTPPLASPTTTSPGAFVPAGDDARRNSATLDERLNRCETLLQEIRDGVDRSSRHTQYQELSLGRICGGLAQVLALGLAALALVEWVLSGTTDAMYARLAFAGFAQLVALTGFAASRVGT